MYYCKNCKNKSESSVCSSCGNILTRADEIILCPNCKKMYFKPNYDFKCTKCGSVVPVVSSVQNSIPQPQQNMAQMSGGVRPPQFNQQKQGQNTAQYGIVPPKNQQFMGQTQPNMYTQQNAMNQQGANANMQQYSNANNAYANQNAGSQQNSYSNINVDEFNANVLRNEALKNQNMVQNQNMAQNQKQNVQDDFLSLFASNDMQNKENDGQGSIDFDSLRSKETKKEKEELLDDGKQYDENGYEVVDNTSKGRSKKGKKGKSDSSFGKESAGKGTKAFAWIEFVLLIACIVFIGYLMLGQYITTPDPCERAWAEYIKAAQITNAEEDVSEIKEVNSISKQSEDGSYVIYKVNGKERYVIFKITKGLSIGTFFNMSKAEIVEDKITSEEQAENKMEAYAKGE